MRIQRLKNIAAWQLARESMDRVQDVAAAGTGFFALQDPIPQVVGSSMRNVADGFDSGRNPEFFKFLRYAQRSRREIKNQPCIALDRQSITQPRYDDLYRQAAKTHA